MMFRVVLVALALCSAAYVKADCTAEMSDLTHVSAGMSGAALFIKAGLATKCYPDVGFSEEDTEKKPGLVAADTEDDILKATQEFLKPGPNGCNVLTDSWVKREGEPVKCDKGETGAMTVALKSKGKTKKPLTTAGAKCIKLQALEPVETSSSTPASDDEKKCAVHQIFQWLFAAKVFNLELTGRHCDINPGNFMMAPSATTTGKTCYYSPTPKKYCMDSCAKSLMWMDYDQSLTGGQTSSYKIDYFPPAWLGQTGDKAVASMNDPPEEVKVGGVNKCNDLYHFGTAAVTYWTSAKYPELNAWLTAWMNAAKGPWPASGDQAALNKDPTKMTKEEYDALLDAVLDSMATTFSTVITADDSSGVERKVGFCAKPPPSLKQLIEPVLVKPTPDQLKAAKEKLKGGSFAKKVEEQVGVIAPTKF